MEIKVLGHGCANCNRLEALVKEVMAEKGVAGVVQRITEDRDIFGYGVMRTPELVVDGKSVSHGRVPSKAEIAG